MYLAKTRPKISRCSIEFQPIMDSSPPHVEYLREFPKIFLTQPIGPLGEIKGGETKGGHQFSERSVSLVGHGCFSSPSSGVECVFEAQLSRDIGLPRLAAEWSAVP
jgi:hypothetical protein